MIKKVIVFLLIIGILAIGGIVYFLYSFGNGMCGKTEIAMYPSPNNKHIVSYYETSCGATTATVENVEIDNKLILRATTSGNNSYPFIVKWLDDKKLSINMASTSVITQIYEKQDTFKDIQILY